MRFGEDRFAYLSAFIAPLVWVAATYMAFWLFNRSSPVYTDIVTFIISGLFPYATFRFTVTAIGRSRAIMRDLLVYPTVHRWHAVCATSAVEMVNSLVFVALVMVGNYLIFGNAQMARPAGFLGGLLLAWGLGVAYGYLFVNLMLIKQTWWAIGQAILRPSFFISAVFFTANELPERIYDFLGWNPLLHAVEATREAMLVHYQSRVVSVEYVLVWIALLFAAGYAVGRLRRS
jgi:ABC-type polysaccharide/polyol phosphate export permease